MSEEEINKEDIMAGASGSVLNEGDKQEAAEAAEKPKKKATRKRAPKKESIEVLERRLEEVEQKLAAHQIETHRCTMCHKGGATIQRGNTGEFFHGPCLQDFRNGKDPIPQ